jgi:hypothetical protein
MRDKQPNAKLATDPLISEQLLWSVVSHCGSPH